MMMTMRLSTDPFPYSFTEYCSLFTTHLLRKGAPPVAEPASAEKAFPLTAYLPLTFPSEP